MTKAILSICSLLVCALGFAGSARADYTLKLDCRGDGGDPTWAGTSNTITVWTKINNVWAILCSDTGVSCSSTDSLVCTSSAHDASKVQEVFVSINGSDAYWLDKMTLVGRKTWGVDNNTGWCFSNGSESPSQFCYDGWASYRYYTP